MVGAMSETPLRGIFVARPDTPEWFAARSTGIGASEIAAAAGLSRYSTPTEVALRKLGRLPEFEGNKFTRLGRKLEPVVVSEFAEATGRVVLHYPMPMFRHEQYACILATPDAQLCDNELLECKTTGFQVANAQYGDQATDDVPVEHLCQAQIQMAVCGASIVRLACLVDGRELRLFVVQRNGDLIGELIATACALWQLIQAGQVPEVDWTHQSALGLVKEMHRTIVDKSIVPLSPEMQLLQARREEIGFEIRALKAEDDSRKARLLNAIGDNAAGDLGDGFVLRRKLITKEPYIVETKPYIDFRRVTRETFLKD